jgi:hypothetical protein
VDVVATYLQQWLLGADVIAEETELKDIYAASSGLLAVVAGVSSWNETMMKMNSENQQSMSNLSKT